MFSKVREIAGYSVMVVVNLLLTLFPRSVMYRFADYAMLLGYIFCRTSRNNVLANIEYILRLSGNKSTGSEFKKKVRRITKQVFINFGKQFYDMMLMTRYNRRALEDLFDFEQVENIGELLKMGKGAIGVTAHFSSWELCATMLAMQYGTISAVFMKHLNEGINRFYINQRAAKNVKAIMPGNGSFKQCLDALRRNEILAFVGDIDYSNNGIEVEFLGRRTRVPKGPPLLALRSGSPLFSTAFLRTTSMRIKLEFIEVIHVPEGLSIDDKMKNIAMRYLKYFEQIILRDPAQWIYFHPLADLPPANGEECVVSEKEEARERSAGYV